MTDTLATGTDTLVVATALSDLFIIEG